MSQTQLQLYRLRTSLEGGPGPDAPNGGRHTLLGAVDVSPIADGHRGPAYDGVETWLVESAEEAAALRAACGDGDDAWITTRRHVVLGGAPLTAADAGFGIVMVVGMCRREGMALDTFQRHWLGEHARITLAAPGTSRYEIALPIVDDYAAGAPALDGLAELWWCSQADLDAYLASPAMAAVGADMETFVSPERALYSLYSTRGLTWLTGEAATAGKERR